MDSELSYKYYKIKTIDKASIINIAWDKSIKIYEKVKNVYVLTNWAFDIIEIILEKSLTIVRFIEKPIYNIDKELCRGIDFVEVKLPIIKENPAQILEKIYRPALQIFVDFKNETEQRVTLYTY
ncbi:hypothetical protein HCN44_006444 [Aphidius gifuensis]|uniref:Uncharacterized protein n=1 Tax=Aphidius gifuensis TaxID=684658 RepID=A0A834XZY2_APHGI|nr:hypothetical protein HCN44_006444 [Aphidius gifuensis]